MKSTLIVFSIMLGCVLTTGAQDLLKLRPHWFGRNWMCACAAEFCFFDKERQLKYDKDTVLQGSTVSVRINWEPLLIDSIVFDTAYYKYKPGTGHAYEFQLKPEKTTTYKWREYSREFISPLTNKKRPGKVTDFEFTIHVVDKNGIELRDENEAGYNDKKQKKKYSKRKKRKE